jgi:hypothetical protein
MSEQPSPWARPEPGSGPPDAGRPVIPPTPATPAPTPPAGGPLWPAGSRRPSSGALGSATPAVAEKVDLGPGWSRAGNVTLLGAPPPAPPDVLTHGRDDDAQRRRRQLMFKIFGGTAGAIVTIGIVVILALVMSGHNPLRNPLAGGPKDVLPPLAKACPPPSGDPQDLPPAPPPPPGPRTVDEQAGISYAAQGAPWMPWDENWSAGDLHVRYTIGQHFITETYTDKLGEFNQYHASILSGSVPAAANDALTLDLKCTGHQVLADVRRSYYPQPNTIDMMRDEVTTLGGRQVWVSKFRLHFHETGLKATSELVGLALINVGRPNAAVLYISIPGTHSQYDPVVDSVLNSVRPT